MTTAKEIADAMLAATSLTEETGLADLYAYRSAKRATGAPVDMERAVIHAGRECQQACDALAEHLKRAAAEATSRAAALAGCGVRYMESTWFVLDGRVTADALAANLRAKREHFQSLVEVWVSLADRIVATDEDRAEKAAELARYRAARIAEIAKRPKPALVAAATSKGIAVTGTREEIAAALVDAGVTASE